MCHILRDFQVAPGSHSGLRVKLAGAERYVQVLRAAFPAGRWIGPLEKTFDPKFDHVLYVDGVDRDALERFLGFASETLLCSSSLDELWAFDWHMRPAGRSVAGDLVYRAKTYSSTHLGDVEAAAELGRLMTDRFRQHPALSEADVVLGVPAFPPREPYNLPELLAEVLASELRVRFNGEALVKTRETSIKSLPNEAKLDALRGVYEVRRDVEGINVILVDDLLRSGSTLGVIGDELRAAGAAKVIGIVATKTMRG